MEVVIRLVHLCIQNFNESYMKKEKMIMKKRLLKKLEEEFPDIDFMHSYALVDEEILDSIALVNLVMVLSMEFGISIPYEEITAENFNSVDAMMELITSLS